MERTNQAAYQNWIFYEVFVRNHTAAGTFEALIPDLDRIKNLGVDVIWLMPIHPIGKVSRKGSLGSPYAVADYRSIDPDYGSIESFMSLLTEVHSRGLKLIMDIVYNHVAPDSIIVQKFPDWLYRPREFQAGRKVPAWSDIVDLDYANMALWDYQVETLKFWLELGVDGFRADVAPLLPLDFWRFAREEITEIKKDCIWLAETMSPDFLLSLRRAGHLVHSDCEMYTAFDLTYDYDSYYFLKQYLSGEIGLAEYLNYLLAQDFIYPAHYGKLRFLENHDQTRAAKLLPNRVDLFNWTAFQLFLKGPFLINAGQEVGATHLPSLFEKDVPDWQTNEENTALDLFLKRMIRLKKSDVCQAGNFTLYPNLDFIAAKWELDGKGFFGIFNVEQITGERKIHLPDGAYANYLAKGQIEVRKSKIQMTDMPVILRLNK